MNTEIEYLSDRSSQVLKNLENSNLDLDLIYVRGDKVVVMIDQSKPKIKRRLSSIFGKGVIESQLGGYSNLDKGIDLPNKLWIYEI